MGRPKEFDREEVLLRAVDTFSRKGFLGTSVQDLVDSLGIHRASLYDTYGSKQQLFQEVMERYATSSMGSLTRHLERPGPTHERLRNCLLSWIEETYSHPDRTCLMATTALSVVDDLPGTSELIRGYFEKLDQHFREVLEDGKRNGELKANADSAVLARRLRTHMMGMIISARAHEPREQLEQTVDQLLECLA